MIKGILSNGFKFEIDERVKRDARFLELIRQANRLESIEEKTKEQDAEYLELTFSVIERMLGEKQKEKLFAHLEDKDGFVDWVEVNKYVAEIMQQATKEDEEIKN